MTDLQATSPPARPVPARGTGSATSVKLAGFSPLTALLIFRLKGPTATVHIYSNVHRHGHYRQKRSHVQTLLLMILLWHVVAAKLMLTYQMHCLFVPRDACGTVGKKDKVGVLSVIS